MTKRWVPELLSPAGNLEKLQLAVNYGADAVYVGGQKYGLRSAADNFTMSELAEGVEYAHARNCRVFVVLNSFLHDEDFEHLDSFIQDLDKIGVDAVIVSDIGVIDCVQKNSSIEVHLSTQASCLNSEAAKFWKSQGVKRVVLGRESSIEDAARIKKESGLEVELFIHGSMCMAYSGNCVISNFTQGRDSNRGGCAHSCRFEYSIAPKEDLNKRVTNFFMSSKDLNGLSLLEKYRELGIDSLKIEGRMKSNLHVTTLTQVYSKALEILKTKEYLSDDLKNKLLVECEKIGHRAYTLASLVDPADESSIYDERDGEDQSYQLVGNVIESSEQFLLLEVKSPFFLGGELEILSQNGEILFHKIEKLQNFYNEDIEKSRPGSLAFINPLIEAKSKDVVRQRVI